jgi:hypothetical protein
MTNKPGSVTVEKSILRHNMFKKNNYFNNNKSRSVTRTLNSQHEIKSNKTIEDNDIVENFERVDTYSGFFTSQQLENLDFSKFENHVFFDSAISKTQYAYQKILNEFPYDQTEYSVNQFMRSLDGYTKYIYDNKIHKNLGYLNFNGTNEVFIKDKTGNILGDFSGESKVGLLNINRNRFCFEFWLKISDAVDDASFGTQILLQKKDSANNGVTIYLQNLVEIDNVKYCDLNIIISNGNSFAKSFCKIKLESFVHVSISGIVVKGKRNFKLYLNGERQQTTSTGSYSSSLKLEEDYLKSDLYIGNGLTHTISRDNTLNVSRTSGLIGTIDEFRFFTTSRGETVILEEMHKEIYSRNNLSLYYKFNEPSGSYLNNYVTLDSSGNKVHGIIRNHNTQMYSEEEISNFRTISDDTPMKYENIDLCPVLFPNYSDTLTQQQSILDEAAEYDNINPNIVWKYFPKNIFVDSADFENSLDIFVSKEEVAINRNAELELLGVTSPANSILANLILIWARFFDDIKCYIDQITEIIDFDYENLNENQTGVFLTKALSQIGVNFKEIFPNTILEKLDGKNLTYEKVFNEKSIRQIQNQLWKRFLINSQDYLRSKGTRSSIKSIFNSFGLEPDLFLNIREFKSKNKINMKEAYKDRIINLKSIDFYSNSTRNTSVSYDPTGVAENKVLFTVPFYQGQDVYYDLSGDWSLEYFVKFDKRQLENYSRSQSIFRLNNLSSDTAPYINVVYNRSKSNKRKGTLSLYVNETNQNNDIKVCSLTDVCLLEGNIIYINVNKRKLTEDYSDYTLSCSQSDFGSRNISTKSSTCVVNIENKQVDLDNVVLNTGFSNLYSQNTITNLSSMDFETCFEGNILNVKFWKQTLNNQTIETHKTDLMNYGLFDSDIVSAHDNLLVNVNMTQQVTDIQNSIQSNQYSLLNDIIKTNSIECNVFVPDSYTEIDFIKSFDYIILEQSPEVDYPENYSHVDVASFEEANLSKSFDVDESPLHDVDSDFSDYEDIRLSIDFSTSKFINKEIAKIINVHDFFSKTMSNASSLYDESYQDLTELREVFYQKLSSEINIKQLYQIYKYFDRALEELLFDSIPIKVHYHGFNFVIESNIAERHKYQYKMSECRMPLNNSTFSFGEYSRQFLNDDYWSSISSRSTDFETRSISNNINKRIWRR